MCKLRDRDCFSHGLLKKTWRIQAGPGEYSGGNLNLTVTVSLTVWDCNCPLEKTWRISAGPGEYSGGEFEFDRDCSSHCLRLQLPFEENLKNPGRPWGILWGEIWVWNCCVAPVLSVFSFASFVLFRYSRLVLGRFDSKQIFFTR